MSINFPHLGLEFPFVPTKFYIIGSFGITIYGIIAAFAMIMGIGFAVIHSRRQGIKTNAFLGMTITAIIFGIIGARLYYMLLSFTTYSIDMKEMLDFMNGGFGFYGALILGSLVCALYCKIAGMDFWKCADSASLGILLGQAIGVWGVFFSRESFGPYTDWYTAMQLPLTAVNANQVSTAMRDNLVTIEGASYIQVHPLFLYESVWFLLLFLILTAMSRFKKYQGEIFMRYLTWYGFGCIFFEFLRSDALKIPYTKIPASMVIGFLSFIIFGFNVIVRRSMIKKREDSRRRRQEALYEAEEKAAKEGKPIAGSDWNVPVSEILEEIEAVEKENARRERGEEEETEADPFTEDGSSLESEKESDAPEDTDPVEKTAESEEIIENTEAKEDEAVQDIKEVKEDSGEEKEKTETIFEITDQVPEYPGK